MSPALGSSVLEHFERRNAIEVHNGIMFDFNLELPHVWFDFSIGQSICTVLLWQTPEVQIVYLTSELEDSNITIKCGY